MAKDIIMSGMRPTGKLHLGNYFGALENWVKLQDEYKCFHAIVDWHALTTAYEDTSELQQNIMEVALDWLSAGLDPDKCIVYVQSEIKEIAELFLLLSMITPVSWLERCPTYKDQLKQLEGKYCKLWFPRLSMPYGDRYTGLQGQVCSSGGGPDSPS